METVHTQDRTIGEHVQRMKTERQVTEKHRLKAEVQDNVIKDMQSTVNQLTTEVAIWRSRCEDMSGRVAKKRKLDDDTSGELIAATAEVKFLGNVHEESMKRIQLMQQEQSSLIQQIQSLQVKLAIALTGQ
jgi:predicted  nucleic acid-binding Zn-ribbon protein